MKSKFFCDIMGTFDGGTDRVNSLIEFISLLDGLDDCEELNFSFISSDNIDFVDKQIKELHPYAENSRITFGKQYANNKVLFNQTIKDVNAGKALQIYTDLFDSNYDNVYYADDSIMNLSITQAILKKQHPNTKFIGFNPSGGIDSLNQLLHNHIEQNLLNNKKAQ